MHVRACSPVDALTTPFSELMASRQLSPYVTRFITYALALADSDASGEELRELLEEAPSSAEEKSGADEPEDGGLSARASVANLATLRGHFSACGNRR